MGVAGAVGAHPRRLSHALGTIQERCHERGWPTLTVWVVQKDSGLPGAGCDVVAPGDVAETARRTQEIEWPAEPWW